MIGSNVSTVGGIAQAFAQAEQWECECFQIYTTPSRKWQVPLRPPQEIHAFRRQWKSSNVKIIVAHVPFLVNLASGDSQLFQRSVNRLIQEVASADELGIDRLVLHPGSSTGNDYGKAVKQIALGINTVFSALPNAKPAILLETMAGQGSQIGSHLDDLKSILDLINEPERVGVCVDTCHMYAAGYDLRGYDGLARILGLIGHSIGLSRVRALHLNDSRHPLGSRKDRHAALGFGHIGIQTFHSLVRTPELAEIPMIVENPRRDTDSLADLTLLRRLMSVETHVPDPRRLSSSDQPTLW